MSQNLRMAVTVFRRCGGNPTETLVTGWKPGGFRADCHGFSAGKIRHQRWEQLSCWCWRHVGVSAETKTSNAASLSTASKRHERIQFKLLLVKPTKWTPFMTWIRYVFFHLKNSGRFWLNPRKVCEFYNSFQHHSLSVDLNIIHSTPVKSGSGYVFFFAGQKLWFSCEKTVWMHSDHHCGLRNS